MAKPSVSHFVIACSIAAHVNHYKIPVPGGIPDYFVCAGMGERGLFAIKQTVQKEVACSWGRRLSSRAMRADTGISFSAPIYAPMELGGLFRSFKWV
jgi:hypothetical protein